VWTGLPEASKRRKLVGIDPDLVSFLECGGYWLGEKGTLGGIIAQLERGGVGGGMPNTDPYKDAQVGWGRNGDTIGLVEKHRWLSTAWLALTHESQRVLLARCAPPPAEFRSDEGYGARDKYVEGSHPVGPRPIQAIGKRGKPIKQKQFEAQLERWERAASRISAAASRTSVDAELGEFATLAIMLCPTPDKLLQACSSPNKGNRELRETAIKVAKAASELAHAEWLESKTGADPARTRAQRVGGAK
jgi:hypothetical protein